MKTSTKITSIVIIFFLIIATVIIGRTMIGNHFKKKFSKRPPPGIIITTTQERVFENIVSTYGTASPIKTQSFKMLNLKSGDFRFCVELPIKMQILGLKYTSLASFEKKRLGGKKKVNAIKDGSLILLEMLKLFFIYKILKKKN